MAIILPETYAHAPTKRYIVEYLKHRCNIKAVIDLPHNSFRPHCNAKTLLWIVEKGTPQRDVIFAVAEEIGRDHLGKTKYRIRNGRLTDEVWDDSEIIREELKNPYSAGNNCTLVVPSSDIKDSIFVPRYYWYWSKYKDGLIQEAEAEGLSLIAIRKLIDEGIIEYFKGHGSPPNEYKGWGTIPYVRAGDIGNWALYKNPTSMIPEHVYLSVKGNRGVELQGGDIIFVKEDSYRIGDVAIVLPTDTNILLNDHCIVLRVVDKDNPYGIDHLYITFGASLETELSY